MSSADLRFALRSLRRAPGLLAVAALSIALGIATNVTMFAVLDPLILNPVQLPDGDRLVRIVSYIPGRAGNTGATSLLDLRDLQRQARTVDLAGYSTTSHNWVNGDPPERLTAIRVTAGFLEINRIRPLVGRTLVPEDETRGAPVALIVEHLWRDRFGAEPAVIGRFMQLDGTTYTIVGVVPARPRFPFADAQVWFPMPVAGPSAADRGARTLYVVGRLRQGVAEEDARVEIRTVMRQLAAAYPATNRDVDVLVASYEHDVLPGGGRQLAAILLGAVGLVLLIACANVANLLLARGVTRAREMAVRTALGASRARIVRQLMAESTLLALAGGLLGVVLAIGGIAWARALIAGPGAGAGVEDIRLSIRALGFGAVATVVTALGFGLLPALKTTAQDLTRSLREGGDRGGTAGGRYTRLRSALVSGELALSLVLLISASLLIRASLRLQQTDFGFDPVGAVTFSTALTGPAFSDDVRRAAFAEEVERRLALLPGVSAVGVGSSMPLWGRAVGADTLHGAGPDDAARRRGWVLFFDVSPGYLAATGLRLVRGRNLAETDRSGAPAVVLVNETAARRYWPDADPVGKRLRVGPQEVEVAGVVHDTPAGSLLEQPPLEAFYFPVAQTAPRALTFAVRSRVEPGQLAVEVRRVLEAVAPGQPISSVEPLARSVEAAWRDYRIISELLTVFGSAALLLAVIGVYGAMAHTVVQRIPEIGIRRALGAGTVDVLGLVVRRAVLIAVAGTVAGLPIAYGLARLIASMMTAVRVYDPVVFVGVPALLAATAVAATLIPARRAAQVDAMTALRGE